MLPQLEDQWKCVLPAASIALAGGLYILASLMTNIVRSLCTLKCHAGCKQLLAVLLGLISISKQIVN